jgi:hypothetical protein
MAADLGALAIAIDAFVNGILSTDIREAAEQIVDDLQQAGPSWTGQFSNSWVIQTSGGTRSGGSGASGEPQRVNGPLLSGAELFRKPEVKYTIYNIAPHADVAIDRAEDNFYRPTKTPQTALGRRKWEITNPPSSRGTPFVRGNLAGPTGRVDTGGASRTAPLNWYQTYIDGGKIDRTIKVRMDSAFRQFPK